MNYNCGQFSSQLFIDILGVIMNKGILLILDGYGEAKPSEFNAVTNANTPFLHSLRNKSYSLLQASGESVGLTKNELGGSEVGHMTIGSGRINESTFVRIEKDIKSNSFETGKAMTEMLNNLKTHNADLHLIGMMSDMNIHSNMYHTIKVIEIAKNYAKNIFVHFITDGRDTDPYESVKYLKQLQKAIKGIKNCHILSVAGRFYSMDRESNLDRVELSIKAMFKDSKGIKESEIEKYLIDQHNMGHNDQYIDPVHVECSEYNGLNKQDVIFFTNFREDRMVEMSAMCKSLNCQLYTMIKIKSVKTKFLYDSEIVKNTMCEYLSKLGVKLIKISETTKYAHVTYFFNGGREVTFENEDRIHIKTRKVKDFATTPKMRAGEITTAVTKSIDNNYDLIIVNYSNPDMIGHTGNYEAVVEALEYLDKCVEKVVKHAKKNGYFVLITADHGNSEQMRTKNGEPHMAHTLNPVMCVEATKDYEMVKRGGLRDIAPTILDLMDIKPNKYFEGQTLIKHIDK